MTATYAEQVGMFELSRINPKQHVIDSIAYDVIEAAYLGAHILDGNLDDDEMVAAWAKGHPEGFIAALRNICRAGVGLPLLGVAEDSDVGGSEKPE